MSIVIELDKSQQMDHKNQVVYKYSHRRQVSVLALCFLIKLEGEMMASNYI